MFVLAREGSLLFSYYDKYRTWEDSPELSPKGFQMEEIAAKINKGINNREIQVLPDGTLQFE